MSGASRVGGALAPLLGIPKGRRFVGSVCLALSAVCLFVTAATTGKLTALAINTLAFHGYPLDTALEEIAQLTRDAEPV